MRLEFEDEDYLRGCIKGCQERKHIQQVAFSTYHDGLTQVCFGCYAVRTTINQEDIMNNKIGQMQLAPSRESQEPKVFAEKLKKESEQDG